MRLFRASILPAEKASDPGVAPDASSENRRRHGRLRTNDMSSDLGRVMDLSRSGLRVRARGKTPLKVGEELMLRVESAEATVTLPAVVRRFQSVGFTSRDIGLEFLELDEQQQHGLNLLARVAMTTPMNRPG